MIQLSAAGKRFGHKLLFEGLDWLITSRDRVGLVGANGTGKSTLMKVLAGLETFDYGSISFAKGTSAGYLPQDGLSLSGRSVFDECLAVFSDLLGLEKEMEDLTGQMSELDHASPEYAQVADRYHHIQHEFLHPRRVFDRIEGGHSPHRPGIRQGRLGEADGGVFRRLADAHRAGQAAAAKSRICCCWTNPPTILTSKRATGWKNI